MPSLTQMCVFKQRLLPALHPLLPSSPRPPAVLPLVHRPSGSQQKNPLFTSSSIRGSRPPTESSGCLLASPQISLHHSIFMSAGIRRNLRYGLARVCSLADAGVVDTRKQYCFVIKWINFAARPHPEMTRKRRVVKKPARASARRQSKQG